MQLLTRLANEGLLRIYGNTNVLARARVEKELKVIDELKFSGYF
jgi:DNA polymerase-3 subunit alpha/error-prone DNA polymerase